MTHRTKFWLSAIAAFVVALIAGIVIAKSIPSSGGVENPLLVLPLMLAVVTAMFFASWLWWKNTDDLQQQGQLVSWFWGGSAGGLCLLIALGVMMGRHSDMAMGAAYALLAQAAGAFLVWTVWKFRGRGAAE